MGQIGPVSTSETLLSVFLFHASCICPKLIIRGIKFVQNNSCNSKTSEENYLIPPVTCIQYYFNVYVCVLRVINTNFAQHKLYRWKKNAYSLSSKGLCIAKLFIWTSRLWHLVMLGKYRSFYRWIIFLIGIFVYMRQHGLNCIQFWSIDLHV